jgi:UDP-N-acetylmuramoylalanine--D-glutamate ligase
MISLDNSAGKTVAVLGLGLSGLSAARAYMKGGAEVRAWDDSAERRAAATSAGVPVVDLTGSEWKDIDQLFLSPGIPHTHPAPHPVVTLARAHDAEIVGDIELLARAVPAAKYIAITGTNGKSTTTALIGHILDTAGERVEVGGNLGTPALDLEPLDRSGCYVLELSSYQLELTPSAEFDVAILLNISADHLERHGGLDGYTEAKRRILGACRGTAIIGVDDPVCAAIYEESSKGGIATVIPISGTKPVANGVYAVDGMLYDDIDGERVAAVPLGDVETLPGSHNAQNAAAAYAAARAAGLSRERIAAGIRGYPGLAHRQQLIGVIDGVRYVNDSKATNPDAAARALSCYHGIFWIAGGRAKEGGLEIIEPYLSRVRYAFLIGEAAMDFSAMLADKVALEVSGALETAVRDAHRMIGREKCDEAVVLLSPACASFDQYPNFEARGDDFSRCVALLPGDDRRLFSIGESAQ